MVLLGEQKAWLYFQHLFRQRISTSPRKRNWSIWTSSICTTPHSWVIFLNDPFSVRQWLHVTGKWYFDSSCCCYALTYVGTSVTRLSEISPLWQNFEVFGQLLKALFTILQNFEPTLANNLCFWANLFSCKWPNIEKYSSHLVTLVGTYTWGTFSNKNSRGKMFSRIWSRFVAKCLGQSLWNSTITTFLLLVLLTPCRKYCREGD